MRAALLGIALLCTIPSSVATAKQAVNPATDVKALAARTIPGFTLKQRKAGPASVIETWQRSTDEAQLRVEVVRNATVALAESRLKAVNAKVDPHGPAATEELLFRSETIGQNVGWTNYRATHHNTFPTYRYWKLQNGTLVTTDLTFTKGKPTSDVARGAFITAKKATDTTLRTLSTGQ